MDINQLKSTWKGMDEKVSITADLKQLLRENKHPVLKGIRLQMTIEILAWTIFLVLYYDGLDGHQKPLYANLLLVGAALFVLGHSLAGYFSAKNLVRAADLKQSLVRYLGVLKKYAFLSIASRVCVAICLLLFFITTIQFTTTKYILLAGIVSIFPIQAYLLSRIWKKRIEKIKLTLQGLSD